MGLKYVDRKERVSAGNWLRGSPLCCCQIGRTWISSGPGPISPASSFSP
jgi:hypothetical protein